MAETKEYISFGSTFKCGGCKKPEELSGDKTKAQQINESQQCAKTCSKKFNENISKTPMSSETKATIEKWFQIKEGDSNYENNIIELRKRFDKINIKIQNVPVCYAIGGKFKGVTKPDPNIDYKDHFDEIAVGEPFFKNPKTNEDTTNEDRTKTVIHEASHIGIKDYEDEDETKKSYENSYKGSLGLELGEYYYNKETDKYDYRGSLNSGNDMSCKPTGFWDGIWADAVKVGEGFEAGGEYLFPKDPPPSIPREALNPNQAMSLPDAFANAVSENCVCSSKK